MATKVIVLDVDVAEAISDAMHRAEAAGHCFTEHEDEMWGLLTTAIQEPVQIGEAK